LQQLCDGLSATKIDALLHPFTAADRKEGYRYDVSILQAEFSLTQVLDRPQNGRIFFEEVIRENLDLGRPDQLQLIFDRRVTRRTPGRFRTRVLTEGVTPSLHIDYKHSRIKQYHKEGRALRTATTINDTRDFDIGKRLPNLAALRKVGFQANRRLLNIQRISQDCAIGENAFRKINEPVETDGQRASAFRFADPVVQGLFAALLLFRLLPRGFSNRELREQWASLLGKSPGQMSYHLRRLRLHGLIERVRESHRYLVTASGWRSILFCTRVYNRVLRPGLAEVMAEKTQCVSRLRREFNRLDEAIGEMLEANRLVA
jgi:DNA-binding transcriptional ArsR family regulator